MSAGGGPRIDGVRRVVLLEDLHETEIWPHTRFSEWLTLLEQDVVRHFPEPRELVPVSCPGCARPDGIPAFGRWGFQYLRCPSCRSLYVSPRPSASDLETFYAGSKAMRFWFGELLRETEPERRDRIFRPRAAWIRDLITEYPAGTTFVDMYTKYGAFLDEIRRVNVFDRRYVVQPAAHVRDACRALGYAEMPAADSGLAAAAAVTMLEVIDRASDPVEPVDAAWKLLGPGGMLFLTTTSGTGFAVAAVGSASPQALPPLHLNLLSVEGLAELLRRRGFEIIELSTPGQLDVEMIVNAARADPSLELSPVISEIVRHRGPDVHRAFQQFLQEARLSTHVRAAARKPGGGPTA